MNKKMKKVQAMGILDSINTMKDRTLKLVFRTQELPPEEAGILHGLVHNEGWVLFAPNSMQESDIPKEKAEVSEGKSPSKRLYSVLFVYWKQQGSNGDFDTWRRQYMERIIDRIKAKLEPDYE